jgi:hypothetical protein
MHGRKFEFVDAGAAALEGGLHGWLYGERHGGGGGLSLRSCGWHGLDGGASWCWRRYGFGISQIVVRRSNSGTKGGRVLGSGARIFPGKSSAPRRQQRRCLRVSLPSWGHRYGHPSVLWLRVKTPDFRGLDDGRTECVVTLLGASLWSSGFTSSCLIIFGGKFWFSVFFLLIFDLLCKRFSSPPCIGLAVVALFIKRGKSLF